MLELPPSTSRRKIPGDGQWTRSMPTTRRVAFADLAAEIATEVRLLRAITAELAVHADAREIEKGREGPQQRLNGTIKPSRSTRRHRG